VASAKYKTFYSYEHPICTYVQRRRCSSLHVIRALCKAFPEGVRKLYDGNRTLLHFACSSVLPLHVVSFLLDEWPEAVGIQDGVGKLPLHYACANNSPKDVISLLLRVGPSSAMVKDDQGRLPLHWACMRNFSPDAVPLLLEVYPKAAMTKDKSGQSPVDMVHFYVSCIQSVGYLTSTVGDEDDSRTMIMCIGYLIANRKRQEDEEKVAVVGDMMRQFIEMKWWGGVSLLFDLASPSSLVRCFDDIPLSVLASALSMVGENCRMLTLWSLIKNKQDILQIC